MTSLRDIHQRCLAIRSELPKHRFAIRPKGDPHAAPPTVLEVAEFLRQQNLGNRERIDDLCKRATLDWEELKETPETWFLVEQRVQAAVYFCERMLCTLDQVETLALSVDTPDDAMPWALVGLWRFAGPLWLNHAARLIVAGMDLSSAELPPPS